MIGFYNEFARTGYLLAFYELIKSGVLTKLTFKGPYNQKKYSFDLDHVKLSLETLNTFAERSKLRNVVLKNSSTPSPQGT